MNLAYDLCGYDKATELLAVEYAVPARLLPTVRTLIKPVADDHDLVLPYELTTTAVVTLGQALGLAIDPTAYHYYFEASDASDIGVESEKASAAESIGPR